MPKFCQLSNQVQNLFTRNNNFHRSVVAKNLTDFDLPNRNSITPLTDTIVYTISEFTHFFR